MRLFSSPRWSYRLRVCCVASLLAVMATSLPWFAVAQRKEPSMEHPTF